jgi:hypothetical protein
MSELRKCHLRHTMSLVIAYQKSGGGNATVSIKSISYIYGIGATFHAKADRKKNQVTLKERTPKKYRCTYMAACPAVFEDPSNSNYVIIGRHCDPASENLSQRVGVQEAAVSISSALLKGSLAKPWWEHAIYYGMAVAVGSSLPYLPQILRLLRGYP